MCEIEGEEKRAWAEALGNSNPKRKRKKQEPAKEAELVRSEQQDENQGYGVTEPKRGCWKKGVASC